MSSAIDEDLLSKASDCIEIISKRRKIVDSVTNHFVTNIVDLSNDAINKLKDEAFE
jgi:hypothetical protein